MESPRGFNDATLGAFAEVARRTDLIVLLGKAFDFTLKFGGPPIDPACRFISIDPEGALVERAARELGAAAGVRLRRRHAARGGSVAAGWRGAATGALARRSARADERPPRLMGRSEIENRKASCIPPNCSRR